MRDIGEGIQDLKNIKAGRGLRVLAVAAGVIILALILNPFVVIGPGQRGVVMTFGAVQDRVMGEGLNIKIPLVQRVVLADVRVHKSQVDAEAASKDMQDATSTIAVNYHVSPEKVNVIFQTIGVEYKDRIIDPSVQEAVKAVTAKYTAVELITTRERVRSEIKDLLKERLMGYNIIVDDFSVVNFKFSRQFTEAIESKQTAEQLALKAQRDLERIKIEAEQKVASARAEAESLRLQKENVSPLLVELRRIEATMKAIDKWDGKLPKVTGGAMPFLDLKTLDDGK
jgi:regulator of protease activity HflC (stomatin/prohibitin superfamily)